MYRRQLSLLVIITLIGALAPALAMSAVCGNGLIEAGETCADCPADCTARSCTPTAALRAVTVNWAAPPEQSVLGLTVMLGYRSGTISLPGTGADTSVRSRVKDTPPDSIVAVNDRDYALRIVLSRATPIPAGKLVTVDFDSCAGASAAAAADFSCVVEGCANQFGRVTDCTCSVTAVEAPSAK